MRTFIGALVATTLLCAGTIGIAWAGVQARTSAPRIVATVRCAHPAEDSLAHVRLVALTHDGNTWRVAYACKRAGY
jgi:hypothetical protein